MVEKTEMKHF